MKKQIFILVILFVGFSTYSCIIEDGDTRPRATAAGKLIYDNTEQVISNNLVFADIALKLNAYIVAASDKKTVIEDRYFPQYKPRNTGNNWVLLNSPYSIITYGKSMDLPGAKWTISRNNTDVWSENGYGSTLSVTIECVGDKQWEITSKDAYSYETVSNSDLIAKATLNTGTNLNILYDYTITGSGNYLPNDYYVDNNSIRVDYTINNPMKFVLKNPEGYSTISYNFGAVGGKLEMVVSNTRDPDKRDLISSDLSSSIGNNVVNRITFKGVTEVW